MRRHLRAAALSTLLIAGLASAAMPINSEAQTPKKSMCIGLIAFGDGEMGVHLYHSLLDGLREKGYTEGNNLVVERRYASGRFEHVALIAKELAGLKLDAVLTTCSPTTRAMAAVSHSMSLVMAAVSDPVGQGPIASYARPGGSITASACTVLKSP